MEKIKKFKIIIFFRNILLILIISKILIIKTKEIEFKIVPWKIELMLKVKLLNKTIFVVK